MKKKRKKNFFLPNFLGLPLFQGSVGKSETRIYFLWPYNLVVNLNWITYIFTTFYFLPSDPALFF